MIMGFRVKDVVKIKYDKSDPMYEHYLKKGYVDQEYTISEIKNDTVWIVKKNGIMGFYTGVSSLIKTGERMSTVWEG
jgi:hypothetical protein